MKDQKNRNDEKIAWDMRYGLPNQKYLEFITLYILQKGPEEQVVDPFSLDVPENIIIREGIYVVREKIHQEISYSSSQIIIGDEGSGKTTLSRKLPELLNNLQYLIVRLSLAELTTSIPEQELGEGKASLLTKEVLIWYLFNSYWDKLLCSGTNRAKFLPYLRQDQHWMARLRWFYQRYCPLYPNLPNEFELMAWLNTKTSPSAKLFSPDITADDILRELVQFVTSSIPQPERYGGPVLDQPYAQILLLIDGTEGLSPKAVIRLVQDAQRLHSLSLSQMYFKLFADSAIQPQIEKMDCVRQGRIAIYHLPEWTNEELYKLLQRRLETYGPGGEFVRYKDDEFVRYDWGRLLRDTHLTTMARAKLVEIIVNEATHPKTDGVINNNEKSDLASPIHTLRLARVLLAACAGCWAEQGFVPPLGVDQLKTLARIYWQAELGGV